ncbi:MAG: prolipoprotein diacylglyceryl transferase [Egibacteraceae bacterium]
MPVTAALAWPILERIHILGRFAISPHGISIALGFLLGAQLMQRRAQRRGVARRPVEGIPEIVQSFATWAALGTIVGARLFYVATRPELYPDPLDWLKIWEGGLSLLGGMAGALLAVIPYAVRRKLSVRLLLDSVAPGVALGIFIGRIGDLIIGEHLGGTTTFFLGWRCTGAYRFVAGEYRYVAPGPWLEPRVQGCYDAVVHQTALYDLLAAGLVLAALLLFERRARFDGFFAAMFVLLYGGGRFVSDFARAADLRLVGPFTGSQVTVLMVMAAVGLWILLAKPYRHHPYAWSPPDFPYSPDGAEGTGRSSTPEPVRAGEDLHD